MARGRPKKTKAAIQLLDVKLAKVNRQLMDEDGPLIEAPEVMNTVTQQSPSVASSIDQMADPMKQGIMVTPPNAVQLNSAQLQSCTRKQLIIQRTLPQWNSCWVQ